MCYFYGNISFWAIWGGGGLLPSLRSAIVVLIENSIEVFQQFVATESCAVFISLEEIMGYFY